MLGKTALFIWAYPETAYRPAVRPDDEVSIFNEEFVFTGRKITSFTLNGTIYPALDWADTIRDVCKLLYGINPEILKAESRKIVAQAKEIAELAQQGGEGRALGGF